MLIPLIRNTRSEFGFVHHPQGNFCQWGHTAWDLVSPLSEASFWKKPPGHPWSRTSQIFTCTPITGGSCENSDSDLAGLEWGLRLCTANKLLGDADVVGPETRLNIKELEAPEGLIDIKH